MSVPANLVYTQGTGAPPITADGMNTFVQVMNTLAGARGFTGTSLQTIYLQGYSAPNDGGQGNFYWNTTTGTDDGGITTIVPIGSTAGCWSRISNSSVLRTPQTVNNAAGVTLTGANVVGDILIRLGAVTVSDALPSASAIIASINSPYGAQAGSMRDLIVINENSGTLTLTPGAGVTFTGNLVAGNFAITTLSQRFFKIYIASASAVTIYG